MESIILQYYSLMGPPSYMRSVVDRNVVMRCIPAPFKTTPLIPVCRITRTQASVRGC